MRTDARPSAIRTPRQRANEITEWIYTAILAIPNAAAVGFAIYLFIGILRGQALRCSLEA